MEGNAVIDNILDECSQFRVLLVGSSRGKAQLLREVFGVNRITRYPPDFSRDEEIYSQENEHFVAHVFDNWRGVKDVLTRRRPGGGGVAADELIHCIWHYVDAQDAVSLVDGAGDDQECPFDIRSMGVPVITLFGRFDNVVNRAAEIGQKRRLRGNLSELEKSDAVQIKRTADAINLYCLQYASTTAITSKSASSKNEFIKVVLSALRAEQVRMLLIIAQRVSPSLKFEASMSLAMKQFLIGTVSRASPLPIPFAGLIGSQAATYMIKQDILRVWNIYDPDFLCSGAQGQQSLMDQMLGIPKIGVKRLIYMIPVLGQISGIWEVPILARALGGLMIDLTLLMERAFIATMGGSLDGLSPIRTPVRRRSMLPAAGSPRTPIRPNQRNGNDVKRPLSAEVLRNRQDLLSPSATLRTPASPLRTDSSNLIDFFEDKPATPPRPSTAPAPAAKPALPPKPSRPLTPRRNDVASPLPATPARPTTPASPMSKTQVCQPLTSKLLTMIGQEYEPIKEAVKLELEEFFNQEGEGLQRSFQKDKVRRKLDEIVHAYRLSEVADLT